MTVNWIYQKPIWLATNSFRSGGERLHLGSGPNDQCITRQCVFYLGHNPCESAPGSGYQRDTAQTNRTPLSQSQHMLHKPPQIWGGIPFCPPLAHFISFLGSNLCPVRPLISNSKGRNKSKLYCSAPWNKKEGKERGGEEEKKSPIHSDPVNNTVIFMKAGCWPALKPKSSQSWIINWYWFVLCFVWVSVVCVHGVCLLERLRI